MSLGVKWWVHIQPQSSVIQGDRNGVREHDPIWTCDNVCDLPFLLKCEPDVKKKNLHLLPAIAFIKILSVYWQVVD